MVSLEEFTNLLTDFTDRSIPNDQERQSEAIETVSLHQGNAFALSGIGLILPNCVAMGGNVWHVDAICERGLRISISTVFSLRTEKVCQMISLALDVRNIPASAQKNPLPAEPTGEMFE